MKMENIILCPNCGKEAYFCLDEWGYTPFHLHCDECNINIGATSPNKCIELLMSHHKPYTWLEYYQGDIQILYEEGREIKDIMYYPMVEGGKSRGNHENNR